MCLPTAPPGCRGAHTFFLREKEVPRWGGYTVNLIHYEDAASLCLAVLVGQGAEEQGPYRGRAFLGCDNAPVTFEVGGPVGRVVFWRAGGRERPLGQCSGRPVRCRLLLLSTTGPARCIHFC